MDCQGSIESLLRTLVVFIFRLLRPSGKTNNHLNGKQR